MGECRLFDKHGRNVIKLGKGDLIGLDCLSENGIYKFDVQISFEYTFMFKLAVKIFHGCQEEAEDFLKSIYKCQLENINGISSKLQQIVSKPLEISQEEALDMSLKVI